MLYFEISTFCTTFVVKMSKLLVHKIIGFLFRPFQKENILFFFLMYLLGLTSIIFELWNGSRFWMTFELFFDLYIYSLFVFLFSNKYRYYIRLISVFVFYLLSIIDMACYVRLGMPITPILLQLALQSNTREATEALVNYLDWKMVCSPLSLVFVQFLLGIYLISHKKRMSCYTSRLFFFKSIKIKKSVFVCVLLLAVFSGISSFENKEYMYYRIIRQYSELETQKVKDFSQKTNFYLPIYRLAYSVSETHRLQREIRQFEKSMDKAYVDAVDYTSPHIVVIIGESYNRHHSTLYGYDKNTTPFQHTRWKNGEMVVFKNMISSWNTTCESFKNMFSTQCVGQDGTWASAPPFPLLFRKAGYHTAFMSNQYVIGNEVFNAFTENAFFNNPKTSQKMFDSRNSQNHDYDLSLVDDYKRLDIGIEPYTLDIFHFLGLHVDFSQRYPRNYSIFSSKDYSRTDISEEDKQILADYDNAIVYNDFVIDSIIKLYENKDAVIIFVPDHGERVFDHSKEWGRSLTWDKNDICQQFDIPFWIWSSSIYRTNHQTLWKQIQNGSTRPGMTDALAQLLLHIAGIHTPWYFPKYDILNGMYNVNRKRIIRNERDYDKIVGN